MEDGYRLWLRYEPVATPERLAEYRAAFGSLVLQASSPTLRAAARELERALPGLLGHAPVRAAAVEREGTLIVGTPAGSPAVASMVASLGLAGELQPLGAEGFLFRPATVDGRACALLAANRDAGLLYGVFHLLRHLQTERPLAALAGASAPRVRLRMLNHWDNLDRTIERGYAGFSLWDWHKLPDYLDPRYEDYARACASVGINAASLTNVNADPIALTPAYLTKVAALAGVFRPYGIRVFLTARFSSPMELGGLSTADPRDARVQDWWRAKIDEIYRLIPDFGGFLVKAGSEGQPGPQDYGRSHAEGANLLGAALAPYGGVAIWRAFVYHAAPDEDRATQAYRELAPLDGQFGQNVALQVKNGPVDFQPREPYHPLFGALPRTPLFLEVMLTQEYLGLGTHLVYMGPLIKEVLDAETTARGAGSTVARVIDGTLHGHALTGMAGVANTGTDRNWCGHPFGQANWFAFGRLAWDHALGAGEIADDWIRMTFGNDPGIVGPVKEMMLGSREAAVDYMTPLGLHHLMARDHHYGPGPWVGSALDPERAGLRPDWTSVYYHRADANGIGFDRTAAGSNAVAQYQGPFRALVADPTHCPDALLLWFHHLPWDHLTRSGRTLWDELCHRYDAGVAAVERMRETWRALDRRIDQARFDHVTALLAIQEKEARWWRNACLLYFQTLSRRPLPTGSPPLEGSLEDYVKLRHRYVPGIPERGD